MARNKNQRRRWPETFSTMAAWPCIYHWDTLFIHTGPVIPPGRSVPRKSHFLFCLPLTDFVVSSLLLGNRRLLWHLSEIQDTSQHPISLTVLHSGPAYCNLHVKWRLDQFYFFQSGWQAFRIVSAESPWGKLRLFGATITQPVIVCYPPTHTTGSDDASITPSPHPYGHISFIVMLDSD